MGALGDQVRLLAVLLLLALAACGDGYSERKPAERRPAPEPAPEPAPAIPEGMFDVGPLLDCLPEDPALAKAPGEAYERLARRRERGDRIVDRPVYEQVVEDLAAVEEHLRRLLTDRAYRDVEGWRQWAKVHPLWRDFETDLVIRWPWLLIYEVPEGAYPAEEARKTAERVAALLAEVHSKFRGLFAADLDLPRLSELRPDGSLLRGFLFARRRTYETYRFASRQVSPTLTYYDPRDQWLVTVSEPEIDGDGIVEMALSQLLHVHRKHRTEKGTGEEIPWSDPRIEGQALWLDWGLSGVLGRAVDGGSGAWRFDPDPGPDVKEWFEIRERLGRDWPLGLLVRFNDAFYRETHWLPGKKPFYDPLGNVFVPQARSFCRFLWERHRKRLVQYLKRNLLGHSDTRSFSTVFGLERVLPQEIDWSGLEEEWRAWAAGVVKGK